jgi:hypothetical protein
MAFVEALLFAFEGSSRTDGFCTCLNMCGLIGKECNMFALLFCVRGVMLTKTQHSIKTAATILQYTPNATYYPSPVVRQRDNYPTI